MRKSKYKYIYIMIVVMTLFIGVGYSYLNSSLEMNGSAKVKSCNSILNIYEQMKCKSVIDNKASKYVSDSTGIKYRSPASNTNGRGVYLRANTQNNTYPIYYYRGEVYDNNILFANICWKIVRTTDTGGIKMVYNGLPTNGMCNSTNVTIGKSVFNTDRSIYSVGYMYDNYDYSDGNGLVSYNTYNSPIKDMVDTWYQNNLIPYESYLEDTIFCNDRSFYLKPGEFNGNFSVPGKFAGENVIDFNCPRTQDAFTVSQTKGNGKLKYPIALLDQMEISAAGSGYSSNLYLSTSEAFWSLSPYESNFVCYAQENIYPLRATRADYSQGVRPAVALKPNTYIKSGDGTANNPFRIN